MSHTGLDNHCWNPWGALHIRLPNHFLKWCWLPILHDSKLCICEKSSLVYFLVTQNALSPNCLTHPRDETLTSQQGRLRPGKDLGLEALTWFMDSISATSMSWVKAVAGDMLTETLVPSLLRWEVRGLYDTFFQSSSGKPEIMRMTVISALWRRKAGGSQIQGHLGYMSEIPISPTNK